MRAKAVHLVFLLVVNIESVECIIGFGGMGLTCTSFSAKQCGLSVAGSIESKGYFPFLACFVRRYYKFDIYIKRPISVAFFNA